MKFIGMLIMSVTVFIGNSFAEEAQQDAWPMVRGTLSGTGRSAVIMNFPLADEWHQSFEKKAFEATPVIADGKIFIGDLNSTFYALSLHTGEVLWSFDSELGFPSAAAVSLDPHFPLVVVGDAEGIVRAFDINTGAMRWTYVTEGEISGGPTIVNAGAGHHVLIGSQDATLSCLRLSDGGLIWKHELDDQIRCSPTVAVGSVFVAGCDGNLHVIDAATGNETHMFPIDGPSGTTPAAHNGQVFFGTEGGVFYAINVEPPKEIWKTESETNGRSYRSSASISSGLAIVGSRGRCIEAFAIKNGAEQWRQPMRGRVDASPVVIHIDGDDAEAIVVGDSAGRIVALHATSGDLLWEFDAGGDFVGGAAVANGRIVFANGDGTIWCFSQQNRE